MEIIARNHLQGVHVDGNSILGYVDDEEKYKDLLGDIDSTTGGFVVKTKKPNKTGRLIFQTVKEGSHINVPFFGPPFYVHDNYTLECVHARSKRTHKNAGLKVQMFSLLVGSGVYRGTGR